MKILQPGHVYVVEAVDAPQNAAGRPSFSLQIRFVRRRGARGQLLPIDQREPGILSQELLRVLIDRVLYLNTEDPCTEDIEIIGHLREALRKFESRAARKTIEKMPMPETEDACPICHHLLCGHRDPMRLDHDFQR